MLANLDPFLKIQGLIMIIGGLAIIGGF